MPSPFPGMDPFIERAYLWSDFHLAMLAAMRAALNRTLPSKYAAAGDRHVWLLKPDEKTQRKLRKPDLFITGSEAAALPAGPAVATAAPATIMLPAVEKRGPRYLKILELPSRRLVTVIELLSPTNKRGPQRKAYLAKRKEYWAAGINLVEIDLLRGGRRMPLGAPPPATCDYYVLVSRAWEMPRAGIWPMQLHDPLPPIPVPLDPGEQDVTLALQSCLDRAYDEGRYRTELDYDQPLAPPLSDLQLAWVQECLKAQAANP